MNQLHELIHLSRYSKLFLIVVVSFTLLLGVYIGYKFGSHLTSTASQTIAPKQVGNNIIINSPQHSGIINEDYIRHLSFPKLTGNALSHPEDPSYKLPLLLKYSNDFYSFQYPVDFKLQDDNSGQDIKLIKNNSLPNCGDTGACTTTISIHKLQQKKAGITLNGLLVDVLLQLYVTEGLDPQEIINNVKSTILGGVEARDIEYIGAASSYQHCQLVLYKKEGYSICIDSGVLPPPGSTTAYNAILSSFEFTKSNLQH